MSQFLSVFLGQILSAITSQLGNLGPILAGWLAKWLGTATLPDPGDIIKVGNAPGAAPSEVLARIEKFVTDFINEKLANHPWLAGLLAGRIPAIVDQVVNQLWDQFFPTLPPIASIRVAKVQALPPMNFSPAEIAKHCESAGLAA